MVSHYKMAAAYAGPVVALDRNGIALAVEHLPEFVLASDYDALAARLAEAERDAARYLYLRGLFPLSGDLLDRSIDAQLITSSASGRENVTL